MNLLILCILTSFSMFAFAEAPFERAQATDQILGEQQFLREYPMGVYRHRIDGGRVYGWRVRNNVTVGRFKGESDEFGFSVDLNRRDRVEVTTGGLRWRRAIGGDR